MHLTAAAGVDCNSDTYACGYYSIQCSLLWCMTPYDLPLNFANCHYTVYEQKTHANKD